MKKLSLLFATLLFVSLSFAQRDGFTREGEVNVDDQFADLMEVASGGIFRGINFDMSKQAVKDYETARNTTSVYKDEEENELIITTDMGPDILNFADITYTFDEKGLYHIKVESYGTDKAAADKVYNMVKNHFTKKLGSGTIAEDGYLEFKGSTKNYSYVVAMENIDYVDSPGMYLYIYLN